MDDFLKTLADSCQDIEVNSLIIDETGQIRKDKEKLKEIRFDFHHDDISYEVRIERDGEILFMGIRADIGYVPYTAEAPEIRQNLITLAKILDEKEIENISLDRNHHFIYENVSVLNPPLTSSQLVSHLTWHVLKACPYIQIIRENLPKSGA